MKNKFNIFYKILPFMLILLGFFYCIFFFYAYFIRQRLPRDIPFILTEFKFYILLAVLFIYLFLIKNTLWPKTPHTFILKIIQIISTPFVHFDAFIKHNKYIYPYYFKLFCYIAKNLRHSFFVYDHILLFCLFNILPRVLLLSIFMFDVLLLNKIEIFYYFILLSLFPLIYNYFKYSLEFALEKYIEYLESIYDEVSILEEGNFLLKDISIDSESLEKGYYGKHNPNAIYHDTEVSIRKYIEIQRDTLLYFFFNKKEDTYEYEGTPYAKDEIYLKYREKNNKLGISLNDSDYELIRATFRSLEYNLIYISIFIQGTKDFYFLKKVNLIVYILYFVCWFYILIVSWASIDNLPITLKIIDILQKYSEISDSFSESSLENCMQFFTLKNNNNNSIKTLWNYHIKILAKNTLAKEKHLVSPEQQRRNRSNSLTQKDKNANNINQNKNFNDNEI